MSTPDPRWRGPVAWMAQNPVASNLLMLIFIVGGLIMSTRVKKELFPEFSLDIVSIEVPFPGASPAEVEQGIVRVIEEAVRGLDGVKKVSARAAEGLGGLTIELMEGTDGGQALVDVKAAVDRVAFRFPLEAEEPIVRLVQNRTKTLSLVIHGEKREAALRELAEVARDELLKDPHITLVEISGTRPREVAIEVPQATLRSLGLSLGDIAGALRRASVELPGGSVRTAEEEILLRTTERLDYASQFAEVPIIDTPGGGRLKVGDLGVARDTFSEVDLEMTFNGRPAVLVDVYRMGRESPTSVSDATYAFIERVKPTLPAGVQMDVWNDRAELYAGRLDLLKRNAIFGLVLVFLALGAFLETRLAFWVMMGIPISFLGAFLIMPTADVSVNMISMFAFIVTLGIVVDDAIVVGENIFEKRMNGVPPVQAAIEGAREVAVPVVFAVLTSVATFSPLLFIPGASGKFFSVIPAIVIIVLLISLVESLFILPAHLAHSKLPNPHSLLRRGQLAIAGVLDGFINRLYRPLVAASSRRRYLTLAVAVSLFLGAIGVMAGGHIGFTPMPRVEGDVVSVSARLPVGTSAAEAMALRDRLQQTADALIEELPGGRKIVRATFASLGQGLGLGGGPGGSQAGSGTHVVEMALHLVSSEQRTVGAQEVAKRWRDANRDLTGLDRIVFSGALAAGGGDPIDIALSHRDVGTLEQAAARLGQVLTDYEGVTDVDDGFAAGKRQLSVTLKPQARALGLTEADLASQIRASFFGAEALRQQRDRDEVKVMVRLPRADRESLATFETLMLRTPGGGEIPLLDAAFVREGRAETAILREDGRRVIHVTADVDNQVTSPDKVLAVLTGGGLDELKAEFPGLTYGFGGQQQNWGETMASLKVGFPMAMFVVFALLAVPFRSYVQPLIIMAAIPFGFIGAVVGHLVLGYDLSIISMMGVVALSGIVVNDSLILVMAVNERRAQGMPLMEAVIQGSLRRFRPILLTSLTTFFGLMPMIFETSVQARFLIPMAISLGFGVLFSTALILLVIPAIYLIVEDIRAFYGIGVRPPEHTPDEAPAA